MPLKDQLTLPTVNDAIAVRPLSLPVPPGTTERRNLRTERSKTFAHDEKAPDGKEIRTFKTQLGAVCYRDDTGELRSIDTTIRNLGTHIGVEWAPYKFRLHETGIGFDFESREGGQCTVTLTGIGGEKFEDSIKPEVSENVITYRDVRPGCDIVFKCLNEQVKTLRILHNENAPREFAWKVASDKPELIDSTLTGTDAAGNQLELVASVDGSTITETWNGETQDKTPVVYPVEIDPTVTVNPAAEADNGWQDAPPGSTTYWYTSLLVFGSSYGYPVSAGIRFPSVGVDQGSTITLATLGLYATSVVAGGGAGTIYARAADNAGQFGINADQPSEVAKTAASTVAAKVATTGQKTWDVTGATQEVVDRAGFALNNAVAFAIIGTGAGGGDVHTKYATYQSGSNIPYLEITYTAAAGGTAGNLLLLGCG